MPFRTLFIALITTGAACAFVVAGLTAAQASVSEFTLGSSHGGVVMLQDAETRFTA